MPREGYFAFTTVVVAESMKNKPNDIGDLHFESGDDRSKDFHSVDLLDSLQPSIDPEDSLSDRVNRQSQWSGDVRSDHFDEIATV